MSIYFDAISKGKQQIPVEVCRVRFFRTTDGGDAHYLLLTAGAVVLPSQFLARTSTKSLTVRTRLTFGNMTAV